MTFTLPDTRKCNINRHYFTSAPDRFFSLKIGTQDYTNVSYNSLFSDILLCYSNFYSVTSYRILYGTLLQEKHHLGLSSCV